MMRIVLIIERFKPVPVKVRAFYSSNFIFPLKNSLSETSCMTSPLAIRCLSFCMIIRLRYGIPSNTSLYVRWRFSMNDAICPNRQSLPIGVALLSDPLRSSLKLTAAKNPLWTVMSRLFPTRQQSHLMSLQTAHPTKTRHH